MQLLKYIFVLGFLTSCVSCKGLTVLDHLKEGFDAVYKIKVEMSPINRTMNFDMNFRKLTTDSDPHKFLMFIPNGTVQFEKPVEQEADPPLLLPIIVVVKNNDLEISEIYAKKNDHKSSLQSKLGIMFELMFNFNGKVPETNDKTEGTTETTIFNQIFGNCSTNLHYKTENDELVLKHILKFSQCSVLMDEVAKRNETVSKEYDVEINYEHHFDATTEQLKKMSFNFQDEKSNIKYLAVFDGLKEFKKAIDETEISEKQDPPKMYGSIF